MGKLARIASTANFIQKGWNVDYKLLFLKKCKQTPGKKKEEKKRRRSKVKI